MGECTWQSSICGLQTALLRRQARLLHMQGACACTIGLVMDVVTNLGCNACMVCPWQPQGGSVAHTGIARHDVLQGHKHCMAHMQSACDIWRWHGHGEWPASG